MASSNAPSFDEWLSGVLETAGVDGEVYGGYISGSLATMDGSPREEMLETLNDILSGCLENEESCSVLCIQVVDEWIQRQSVEESMRAQEKEKSSKSLDVSLPPVSSESSKRDQKQGDKLKQSSLVGELSATDKQRLVAQYGDLSNDEDDDDADIARDQGQGATSSHHTAPSMTDVFQNMNAQLVTQAQREKREKEKVAHEVKVDRDRKNRETQRQKMLDRKEKEKKRTQKHERRR